MKERRLESCVVNVGFVSNECDIRHCYMVIETLSKFTPRPRRKEELESRAVNVGFVCNECDIRHCIRTLELYLKSCPIHEGK